MKGSLGAGTRLDRTEADGGGSKETAADRLLL
jgi:hypothetical protein